MKIPTWVWLLGVAGLGYWAYTQFGGSAVTLGATLTNLDTDTTGTNIICTISVNNNTSAAISVTGLSVAATYTNGSIGTGTWSGSLPVGVSSISVTIPMQASMQSDLTNAIENGGTGYTIQLYATSPSLVFTVNSPLF